MIRPPLPAFLWPRPQNCLTKNFCPQLRPKEQQEKKRVLLGAQHVTMMKNFLSTLATHTRKRKQILSIRKSAFDFRIHHPARQTCFFERNADLTFCWVVYPKRLMIIRKKIFFFIIRPSLPLFLHSHCASEEIWKERNFGKSRVLTTVIGARRCRNKPLAQVRYDNQRPVIIKEVTIKAAKYVCCL